MASEEDAPIPETHFERPVMGAGKKEGPMVWVVKQSFARSTPEG